jgi:phage/plasmid-associated DNA primase
MTNTALRFLESEYVILDQNGRVKGTELYDAYVSWCKENGLTPMGRNSFYTAVATRFTKIPPDKTPDKTTWFKGIRIRRK